MAAADVNPDFMPQAVNLLGPAFDVVTNVEDIITTQLKSANATANALYTLAEGSIAALGKVTIPDAGPIPAAPILDTTFNFAVALPPIPANAFGQVLAPAQTALPTLIMPAQLPDIDVPTFVASISSISIPEPPVFTAPMDIPDAPPISAINVPDAPNLVIPSAPILQDIEIPTYDFETMPTFDAAAPEFLATAISAVLQWVEPVYQPEIMPEALNVIRGMWNGTQGLPPGVIEAMVDRASDLEDRAVSRAIDVVDDEFSLRGFTMPTGMQAARADQIVQDSVTKKLSLNREILIQAAQWQIENVRAAVQNALGAETIMINLFTNQAERGFQAARSTIEFQLGVYNAQVALFNAQQQAYGVAAQVYRTKVDAVATGIQIYRAQVDAAIAQGTLEETKARIYATELQGVTTQLGVYEAQLRGVQTLSDVNRIQIESYRATVEAYAQRVNVDKIMFDAYDSQLRGSQTQASIIATEASAYASLIQGLGLQADIDVKRADVAIQINKNLVDEYIAGLEGQKVMMQFQVSAIEAAASAYTADTQRYVAQAGAEQAQSQVEISANEAYLRTSLALYDAQVKSYETQLNTLVQRANLSLDAIKSAGSLAATVAAGAMAAVHVGATLSGGSSVSASTGISENIGWNYGGSVSESTTYSGN